MNEGSGKSAKLSLLGSSEDRASFGGFFPRFVVEKVVNKADCGIEDDAAAVAVWWYVKEGRLDGESVVNAGGGGAVMETNPSFPRPESKLLEPRIGFVGEALCDVAEVEFKTRSWLEDTFSMGCKGKGEGSRRGRGLGMTLPYDEGPEVVGAVGAGYIGLILPRAIFSYQ